MSADDEPHESDDPQDDAARPDGVEEQNDSGRTVPRWQLPGLDSYLRNVIWPLFNELDSINRIADAARAAMPRIDLPTFDVPTFDLPELRIDQEIGRSLIDVDKALEPMREAVASIFDWSQLAQSLIDPNLIERIRESVAGHMPPNWSELDDWLEAATFIDETGWPIIWLPRVEAVASLLEADPTDREVVLRGLTDTIAKDAAACAADITHDDLVFVAECITEVAASIADGRHRAAQALAASVLTELVQGILGHDELADARMQYAEPWEEKSIQVLRFALITSAIPKALTRFYRQKGDPIPHAFNRHAVAHGASPIQFTPTNALVSLILITALARELQALFDDGILHDED